MMMLQTGVPAGEERVEVAWVLLLLLLLLLFQSFQVRS